MKLISLSAFSIENFDLFFLTSTLLFSDLSAGFSDLQDEKLNDTTNNNDKTITLFMMIFF
jgi:hypothetical protein